MGYRYRLPLDPECPVYRDYADALFNDPMTSAMGAPVDEIMESYEAKHISSCARCREYGAANIEVVD